MDNKKLIMIAVGLGALYWWYSRRRKSTPNLQQFVQNTENLMPTGKKPAPSNTSNNFSVARGVRNNNPGNIKINPANNWVGKLAKNTDGVFEQFDTSENGIRALYKLIKNKFKKGLNTPKKLIDSWSATDKASYTRFVARKLGIAEDAKIPAHKHYDLVTAIIEVENGGQPYTSNQISSGMALA